MRKLFIFVLLFVFIFSADRAYAGGGRVDYQGPGITFNTSEKAPITAWVHDSDMTRWNTGEKFEVIVENPRPGDSCVLTQDIVDDGGQVKGYCTATTPGQIISHLHSISNDINSGSIVIYFQGGPTPTTVSAKVKPTSVIETIESPTPIADIKNGSSSSSSTVVGSNSPTPSLVQEETSENNNALPVALIFLGGAVLAGVGGWLFFKRIQKGRVGNHKSSEVISDQAQEIPDPINKS